jgi:hypothetical protein
MKPNKHYLKKEGERKRLREYNGGVSLFKEHCIHLWNYHNETPWYYQCMLILKEKNLN